jgi:hypothetical protein
MNKVKGIKTDNFEELINQINEFNSKNKVFASQVYPNFGKGMWYGVIHYENQQFGEKKDDNLPLKNHLGTRTLKGEETQRNMPIQRDSHHPADTFNKPTDKQLFFLKKMGVTIPKTKQEATKMIKRLKDLE